MVLSNARVCPRSFCLAADLRLLSLNFHVFLGLQDSDRTEKRPRRFALVAEHLGTKARSIGDLGQTRLFITEETLKPC